MEIFVGNLPVEATKEDVQKYFEPFGAIKRVVIKKKTRDNPRGWGFVYMLDDAQAEKAIAALDGQEFMGRELTVTPKINKIARQPETPKPIEETGYIEVPEVEPKVAKVKSAPKPRKTGVWEKRKGSGKNNAWKKKPGGIKKKFKYDR